MPNQLRDIRKFTDLVRYLESELEWPVNAGSFDDLTFEYHPAELGLKDEDAVKIKKVHQLRPLVSGQTWGVFFVDFEKKKLPVVVLRRILSHLVVKKRQSANKSEQAVWNPEDLLFISAFGDETSDQREIAFAHFHQQAGDLPTLRVLGWDGGDTPLKLDYVAGQLKEKLHWPANLKDQNAWRAQWSGAFRHKLGHTIKTADALAEVLAGLARHIRDAAKRLMKAESENGPLTKLYKGFQTALIHDLKPDDFADTYAQTITYGLLTAAISRTEMSQGRHGTVLYAENITDMVPVTNPFLKEMLQTFLKVGGRKGGIDFDELGIQDVVELLRGEETDLPAILRDFGNQNPDEDPVIHFYEHFLSAYDKPQKKQRGVFYTPQSVVSYIVRSVHELLQTEFALDDGLAATATWGELAAKNDKLKIPEGVKPGEMFVQILDPATGTATFLVEVIDVIYRMLKAKWDEGGLKAMPKLPPTSFPRQPAAFGEYWNKYVPLALLPRLHGYELMMAPYAIAHMKIGLKLHETGYHFGTEERARIYLTNALEPKVTQLPQIGFDALAHEAAAVNEIKWYKRFTVVIGNPPYAGNSWNLTPELRKIIDPYRFVGSERIRERGALQLEKNLQDDYVKFVCFAEQRIQASNVGISGLVTSHGFLDNIFLRGMRYSLLATYDDLFILDLHGNVLRGEKAPDGSPDKNVFDIKQTGVAISIFTKHIVSVNRCLRHSDLWGDRENVKTPFLRKHTFSTSNGKKLQPSSPAWLFIPRDASLLKEYELASSLTEIMPLRSLAVVTGRDAFVIDHDEELLIARLANFASSNGTDAELDKKFGLNSSTWWSSSTARREMPSPAKVREFVRPLNYRPFDCRYCFYHTSVFESLRRPVMQHLDPGRKNVVLITTRMVKGEPFAHAFIADGLTEAIGLSSKTSNSAYVFPLFIYPDQQESLLNLERHENFSATVLTSLRQAFGESPHPEELFQYIYAILYSPMYRSRYAEFLKGDFPRLPLTGNVVLFRTLARLGGELTALHLLEFEVGSVTPCAPGQKPSYAQITEYLGGRSPVVECPTWSKNTIWINREQTIGFKGVREDVWNFHIGGYQVCEKWLKYRKGRQLSAYDRTHYQKIIIALFETIQLMKEIDAVIEKHGGWPLK